MTQGSQENIAGYDTEHRVKSNREIDKRHYNSKFLILLDAYS